jgi:hypothetical protein
MIEVLRTVRGLWRSLSHYFSILCIFGPGADPCCKVGGGTWTTPRIFELLQPSEVLCKGMVSFCIGPPQGLVLAHPKVFDLWPLLLDRPLSFFFP